MMPAILQPFPDAEGGILFEITHDVRDVLLSRDLKDEVEMGEHNGVGDEGKVTPALHEIEGVDD